jgi:5'-3' exonuclease
MNGIIHVSAQQVYGYGEYESKQVQEEVAQQHPEYTRAQLFNTILANLQQVLYAVAPKDLLVLAVDGVAPFSKLKQQRSRRYKSIFGSPSPSFDPNAITPGTEFMKHLDNEIQKWIGDLQAVRLQQGVYDPRENRVVIPGGGVVVPPKVMYSSHLVPGEGEHKILDFMRAGYYEEGFDKVAGVNDDFSAPQRSEDAELRSARGTHVLYGLDADLIMLSLLSPLDNIFLVRENLTDVVAIDTIEQELVRRLGQSSISDFVLFMFLIGNDFLPPIPAVEDIDEAFGIFSEAYRETGKALTDSNGIVWSAFVDFLGNISKKEEQMLTSKAKKSFTYPSPMLRKATTTSVVKETQGIYEKSTEYVSFDYKTYRNAWYRHVFCPKGDDSIYRALVDDKPCKITRQRLEDICKQYLNGVSWIYDYYSRGYLSVTNKWWYPYEYSPLLRDLHSVLKNMLNNGESPNMHRNEESGTVIHPLHQLLLVLPPTSSDLLPPQLQWYLFLRSPLVDLYPLEALVEKKAIQQDWQGKLLLPAFDPNRVIATVDLEQELSKKEVQEYAPQETLLFDVSDTRLPVRSSRGRGAPRGEQRGRGRGRGEQRGRGRGRGAPRGEQRGRGRGAPRGEQRGRGAFRGRGQ